MEKPHSLALNSCSMLTKYFCWFGVGCISLLGTSLVALAQAPQHNVAPIAVSSHSTPTLPAQAPELLGMVPERLAVADALVREAVEKHGVPGAVLYVGRNGKMALRRAYGNAGLRPQSRPMTEETIFDLASLTKPLVSTAVMRLIEERRIELDAPVGQYLPAFSRASGDKARITIRHLLTHGAGLRAGGAYAGKQRTTPQIAEEIAASPQVSPPGTQFLYSDFSFIVLGAVIEAVTG
jgi:CubicO group peptidase (beta-lactamase class C family)